MVDCASIIRSGSTKVPRFLSERCTFLYRRAGKSGDPQLYFRYDKLVQGRHAPLPESVEQYPIRRGPLAFHPRGGQYRLPPPHGSHVWIGFRSVELGQQRLSRAFFNEPSDAPERSSGVRTVPSAAHPGCPAYFGEGGEEQDLSALPEAFRPVVVVGSGRPPAYLPSG